MGGSLVSELHGCARSDAHEFWCPLPPELKEEERRRRRSIDEMFVRAADHILLLHIMSPCSHSPCHKRVLWTMQLNSTCSSSSQVTHSDWYQTKLVVSCAINSHTWLLGRLPWPCALWPWDAGRASPLLMSMLPSTWLPSKHELQRRLMTTCCTWAKAVMSWNVISHTGNLLMTAVLG